LYKAKNDGRIDPGYRGTGSLPGNDENPAGQVTQEVRQVLWRKNCDPIVLSTRKRDPTTC
jgi:hypothetical protein